VLTDLKLPGLQGLDLCERIVANRPDIPVVVLTAFGSMETAMAAIRAGAYDFVNKPVDMDALALVLERAMRHRALQDKVKTLSEALAQSQRFDEFIGESPPMQHLYQQLARVATSEAAVLITGESGTGKELVAQALHKYSRRTHGPFVPINCPALPPMLLESELFGHVRGAFTDARTERQGLFLQADGGTLFLDEIGDFPLDLQPKLLRVLETSAVRPVGSNKEIAVDVRVLTATNRDLEAAVEAGRFREDFILSHQRHHARSAPAPRPRHGHSPAGPALPGALRRAEWEARDRDLRGGSRQAAGVCLAWQCAGITQCHRTRRRPDLLRAHCGRRPA
jgi:DNA-binding NtrC family response regulator